MAKNSLFPLCFWSGVQNNVANWTSSLSFRSWVKKEKNEANCTVFSLLLWLGVEKRRMRLTKQFSLELWFSVFLFHPWDLRAKGSNYQQGTGTVIRSPVFTGACFHLSLLCIRVCHFVSSHCTNPSPVLQVFVVCVCVCVFDEVSISLCLCKCSKLLQDGTP